MPRFAANLSLMFTEWPFLDRFAAAADAGFSAVEYLFPYDHPAAAIAARLARHGLTQALFNLPPGDWAAGERGLAALPGRLTEIGRGVDLALSYAAATGARRLHLMAGIADRADPAAVSAYRAAVGHVAERLAAAGIELLLEPINRRSMPGYFLDDFPYAEALIADLGLPNLRLQFDIFHRQILHGDVTAALRRLLPVIGHIQVAGVPERHEPDSGELRDGHIFRLLDDIGYGGFVGCEYVPRAGTLAGLGWFAAHLRAR
ncbi:2-oxo-tetronate isomerase [Zavarzinia compransoris]|uniref:Hydroxypyruvate isomerase n=1 Tax=Zavarzinia compransoris TaxID=1264899 RepID=A0A317E7B7_9PROT|nr:2-oxo-tetronate isomerase [Zavarzinia compransoris]PWR22174.1 hydroxypyruvate isomerase [Zavarzinia compransoris]TDP47073.1 hydroxypyruvate isomerase [Zavarzinia compransoris]